MNNLDLQSEMERAASRMRSIHFDGLKALGVPMATLGALSAKQYTVGMATIEVDEGGTFFPSPDGVPACIVAAVDPYNRPLGSAGLFDLVAFRSSNPRKWWLRTGNAYALGDHLLDLAKPVRVVRTPIDWLAAGGDAVCVLDWSPSSPVWRELRSGPELLFPDDVLRQSVKSALISAATVPPMKVAA